LITLEKKKKNRKQENRAKNKQKIVLNTEIKK